MRPSPGFDSDGRRPARLYLLAAAALVFTGVAVVQLARIQIVSTVRYQSLWRRQTESRLLIGASRGAILDRNGERMAYNLERPIPSLALQKTAGANQAICADISRRGAVRYRQTQRVYPYGVLAGQVVGFVGNDGYGLAGLEYAFDDLLRGKPGWAIVGRDGKQRRFPLQGTPRVDPEPGCHVRLTIDTRVQAIVEKALRAAVERTRSLQGMALVLDPTTGEILAMASSTSFNPNFFGQYESRDWRNLCVSFTYEPGSTFKLVTACSALEEGVKTETSPLDGNRGVFEIYGEEIHDINPYGMLTFREAFAKSSNVCFAKVSQDLGSQRLYKFARSFGFGCETGILLPGEESGVLHPVSLWSGRTLVTMAIGHEVSGTLLQSAMAFAAVGNGGLLLQPRIVKEILSPRGESLQQFGPVVVRRVLESGTAQTMCSFLEDVVLTGTGRQARVYGLRVAGKTGTAEKVDTQNKTYLKDKYMASFIGFVPADHPRLLCAITLDEPMGDHTGGNTAAPAFGEIVTAILRAPELPYGEELIEPAAPGIPEPACVRMPYLVGKTISVGLYEAGIEGVRAAVWGGGDRVLSQMPAGGTLVPQGHEIVLFSGKNDSAAPAPAVVGKSMREALQQLIYSGFRVKLSGSGMIRRQSAGDDSKTCVLECKISS